jgi:hypothetical protein
MNARRNLTPAPTSAKHWRVVPEATGLLPAGPSRWGSIKISCAARFFLQPSPQSFFLPIFTIPRRVSPLRADSLQDETRSLRLVSSSRNKLILLEKLALKAGDSLPSPCLLPPFSLSSLLLSAQQVLQLLHASPSLPPPLPPSLSQPSAATQSRVRCLPRSKSRRRRSLWVARGTT